MAFGQQLSHSDYDISMNTEMAAYKTFQLLDNAILCGTNYNATGSPISLMWEKLLQGKGPNPGPQHQAAFEKARKLLYVEYRNDRKTKLYQNYLTEKNALEQKKIKLQDECRKKYGDQWKAKFDREFNACKENIEFQVLAAEVEPHLKAIEEWEQGPLVHVLKPIKQGITMYVTTYKC